MGVGGGKSSNLLETPAWMSLTLTRLNRQSSVTSSPSPSGPPSPSALSEWQVIHSMSSLPAVAGPGPGAEARECADALLQPIGGAGEKLCADGGGKRPAAGQPQDRVSLRPGGPCGIGGRGPKWEPPRQGTQRFSCIRTEESARRHTHLHLVWGCQS